MADMVIHAIRSAAIVAAVATGGTLAHGVAGMVANGVRSISMNALVAAASTVAHGMAGMVADLVVSGRHETLRSIR